MIEPLFAQSGGATMTLEGSGQMVTAVAAGLAFLVGLPVSFLLIMKTKVEIRKLELEAAALQSQTGTPTSEKSAVVSPLALHNEEPLRARVQVTADPRLLGPLLILLDFIVASVVLEMGHFVLGFLGELGTLILIPLMLTLYIPILRAALRMRKVLRPLQEPGKA